MSVREQFVPIIETHRKMLERLVEQKLRDQYGAIGWGFPHEWTEERMPATWLEDLWKPLVARAMVEDLTGILGPTGQFFVRITPLGQNCLTLGLMHMAPRAASQAEIEALEWAVKPPAEKAP